MISLTGWSLEYVGLEMTLPRLYEMQHFLARHPPVGDLVAAYLGYKGPQAGKPGLPSQAGKPGPRYGTPQELMAKFGAIGGKIKRQRPQAGKPGPP